MQITMGLFLSLYFVTQASSFSCMLCCHSSSCRLPTLHMQQVFHCTIFYGVVKPQFETIKLLCKHLMTVLASAPQHYTDTLYSGKKMFSLCFCEFTAVTSHKLLTHILVPSHVTLLLHLHFCVFQCKTFHSLFQFY